MAEDPDRRAECLFCRIVEGEQTADVVLETSTALVFRDLDPQAPVHLLVVSREHLRDVVELGENAALAAGVMAAVSEVTRQLGIAEFRTVFNTGRGGGQHVFHVHAHVLAGRPFSWPPG